MSEHKNLAHISPNDGFCMIILETGENIDTEDILPSFTIFLHDESLLLTYIGK